MTLELVKKVGCKGHRAGIAQLVEYKLPKLGVASSNLVARSNLKCRFRRDRWFGVAPFPNCGMNLIFSLWLFV
jgi:hypothetical protein